MTSSSEKRANKKAFPGKGGEPVEKEKKGGEKTPWMKGEKKRKRKEGGREEKGKGIDVPCGRSCFLPKREGEGKGGKEK